MTNQLLALSKINGLGPKSLIEIISYLQTSDILNFSEIDREIFFKSVKLNSKQKASILDALDNDIFEALLSEANNQILEWKHMGISTISYIDSEYPKYLKYLNDPPIFLYCKGNLSLLSNTKNVAVVGTRNNTEYGQLITEKTVQFLVQNGYCIVSGLALGIDTIAHQATLESSGKTIAVLVDVDDIAPKSNKQLAENIINSGGLLVAENPPKSKVIPALFAKRDRIQAGLSLGVFPIETGINGGTFHAIHTGKKYNRNIFVPDVRRSGYKDSNITQLEGIKSIIDSEEAFAYTKAEYSQVIELLEEKNILLSKSKSNESGTLF